MKGYKSIVGFRLYDDFKLIEIPDTVDTSPEGIGNSFCKFFVYKTIKKENYKLFYSNIMPRNDPPKRIKQSIENMDFSFLYIGYFTIIPNDNNKILQNKDDYRWAYIYNFEKQSIEFYGDFEDSLESSFFLPYFSSISVNSISMIVDLGIKFDVIPFLHRNHEQEKILQKSKYKYKPHKKG